MRFREESRIDLGGGIAVSKHRHENGLVAIVCPDHGAPLVSFQVWYRVGSADELPGKTGIAHFFEHLMWSPTRTRPAGEFDRLIESVGGDCNAATWVDWTCYRDTVASRDFEMVCELEAERMVDLRLDDEALEAEREVVINERLERVEDDIDGFLDEQLSLMAFAVHPYGRPTIGFLDDIRGLDRPTIEHFYETYYAPHNAVVVIAGDVAAAEALEVVDRHFGAVGAGPAVAARAPITEPRCASPRRRGFDRPTATARLLMAYAIPGQGHPDWARLEALASLLSSGPSSRLYRELVVDREIATYADVDVLPFRDAALLQISVGGTAETTAAELEEETLKVIAGLADEPITAAELDKVRAGAETDFWSELETADGKGEALGHFEAALGDYRMLATLAERLRGCDAPGLTSVARRYLGPERRSAVWATPR
jgi:zinc protease